MHIDDDHLFRGAALTQIAEHPNFTAINVFKKKKRIYNNAYKINEDIGIYIKYSKKPTKNFKEYVFTFLFKHLENLKKLDSMITKLFVVFVCVKDREICVISYSEILKLIEERKRRVEHGEETYTILVTISKNSRFRVYMNYPGRKKMYLSKPIIISRNQFPKILFE